MENLIFSINVVLPMFLMMCLGVFLKKIKLYDNVFLRTANKVTFKVFLPTLLFYNIYSSDFSTCFDLKIVIFAVSVIFITVALLFFTVPKIEKENKNRGVLIQALFRSNFVLFGIPVCTNMFGNESIGITSMLIAIIVPLFNFFSVFALEIYSGEKFNFKKTLIDVCKNPLIIASCIGLIASISGFKLPTTIERTVSDIAKIATPLALILLGGEFEVKNVLKNIKYIVVVCLGKLVVIPTIVMTIAVMLGFRGIVLGALLTMTASPTAVSSFIMAQQSDANDELAGQLVVFTTMCCAVTMFGFIYVLKSLGMF